MSKPKKLILWFIVLLIFVFTGGSVMCMLNSNNRMHYKIYEENGEYYYKNYFSNERIWLTFSDEIALIHEYKTSWVKTYIGLNVWKYIDLNGNVILQPDVYMADAFSEGLAAVIPMEGQKWGYMDMNGSIFIEPQYSKASMFKDGFATVFIEEHGGKWVLINKNGEYLQELSKPLNWESQIQANPLNDASK